MPAATLKIGRVDSRGEAGKKNGPTPEWGFTLSGGLGYTTSKRKQNGQKGPFWRKAVRPETNKEPTNVGAQKISGGGNNGGHALQDRKEGDGPWSQGQTMAKSWEFGGGVELKESLQGSCVVATLYRRLCREFLKKEKKETK